jgi:cell wall-associated NlpC family hydrolase
MTPQEFRSFCDSTLELPYVWGADGPDQFDCSGLVQHLLSRLGLDPPEDQSAFGLYRHFKQDGVAEATATPRLGTLLFFGTETRVSHVALALDGEQMIEAGGGGPECMSPEIARSIGAKVRIRPIAGRKYLVGALTPRLPWEQPVAPAAASRSSGGRAGAKPKPKPRRARPTRARRKK